MLMSPNKDETAVHGCHCRGDMAVRMRKVLQTAGLVFACVICFFVFHKKNNACSAGYLAIAFLLDSICRPRNQFYRYEKYFQVCYLGKVDCGDNAVRTSDYNTVLRYLFQWENER